MKDTICSLEADELPEVKKLVEALHPWPTSNEEAWAIVKSHFSDVLLGLRIYRREAQDYGAKLRKIRQAIKNEARVEWEAVIDEIEEILDADERGVGPCGSEPQPAPPPSSD